MKQELHIVLAIAGLLGIPSGATAEGGNRFAEMFKTDWSKDFSVSFGVKVWVNEWATWDLTNVVSTTPQILNVPNAILDINGNGIIDPGEFFQNVPVFLGNVSEVADIEVQSITSDGYEVVPIPVLSIKWKNLFVSGSYFAQTDYNFAEFPESDVERHEWDVAGGYYVLPPYLALTVGYKRIDQEFGAVDFEIDGPTFGFVGAVPMKWGFSLYTNFAYGFFNAESQFFEAFGQDDDRDADYFLVETGLAWTYDLKQLPVHVLLNSATLTLAYRHQQVETESVVAPFNDDDDGIDTTRGVVLGVNFAF